MKNPILLLSVILLAGIMFVGCSGLPASIISGDQLELIDGAKYWRVAATTADQTEDIAFLKGTSKTLPDGTKATFTSDITIRIRPISSTLNAPMIRLVSRDSSAPDGVLRYQAKSNYDQMCGVLPSYSTDITPIAFGQKDVQIKYSVEVLENGVRVPDGYREVTWGGPGSTPQNELLLANGRVKLNNIAMLSQGVPYPEVGDVVWLPAKELVGGGSFSWTMGRSKTDFMRRFMTICDSQRWDCGGLNCFSDFRNIYLPQLQPASGYAGTGAVWLGMGGSTGNYGTWRLDSSRASALVTVTVSTDLGTLVIKPNTKIPKIESLVCDSFTLGGNQNGYVYVGLSALENPKVMGTVEITASGTKSYISGSPSQVTYYAGAAKTFSSTGNIAGDDLVTVKVCPVTTFPNQPISCDIKTCTRTISSNFICGNNVCETGENTANCPADCKVVVTCNNDKICQAGEPSDCADCSAPPPDNTCAEGNIKLGENCVEPRMLALIVGVLIGLYILFGGKRR